ncbi:hypothetical protein PAXRUDRAFT_829920 [Paxillus rubicundulus Ve08.2h10]|uniref:DUF6533 domain-containing protein n=1 Tax=Paxillus rubicundulus Ve08.2h10 TaxID=930991 RepID=A0A0D0D6P1_9AGAM|nr:hypothetical protein PAXRUDRAFT_829920 [Paxillus rubicundulus Ve08.2h10]
MFALYDHAINLDREINLVWSYRQSRSMHKTEPFQAKFDFTSILYFLVRYLGEAVLIFTNVVFNATSSSLET